MEVGLEGCGFLGSTKWGSSSLIYVNPVMDGEEGEGVSRAALVPLGGGICAYRLKLFARCAVPGPVPESG